jgi:hypothetical protein
MTPSSKSCLKWFAAALYFQPAISVILVAFLLDNCDRTFMYIRRLLTFGLMLEFASGDRLLLWTDNEDLSDSWSRVINFALQEVA